MSQGFSSLKGLRTLAQGLQNPGLPDKTMVQPRRWLRNCIVRESATAFGVGTRFPDRVPGVRGTLGLDSEARWASSLPTDWIPGPNQPPLDHSISTGSRAATGRAALRCHLSRRESRAYYVPLRENAQGLPQNLRLPDERARLRASRPHVRGPGLYSHSY